MLSDVGIRAAKPTERDYKLADAGGPHLFVTKSGGKSWRWKYRVGPKEKRLVIGPYPEITLAEARTERDAARRVQGEDAFRFDGTRRATISLTRSRARR
jgi:hypothetical protein